MKILLASDSPNVPSGFAQQMKGLAYHLSENHDVTYLGWQTRGDFTKMNDYPFKVVGSTSQFAKNDYIKTFQKVQPDLVISLGDAHMVDVLGKIPHPLWFMYFPLDGHPIAQNIAGIIKSADIPIAMAQYGQKLVRQELNQVIRYIPHFVDSEFKDLTFGKKKEIDKIRDKLGIPKNKFIFGSVSRMNPRKHHQRMLTAYRRFLDKHEFTHGVWDNTLLYLHLDPRDPLMFPDHNHNYQFLELIDSLGLSKNVMLTKDHSIFEGNPIKMINELYNAFDVHLLSTGGEGFGVPFIEAASTGLPTIATDYTTTWEHLIAEDPYSGKAIKNFEDQRGIAVPYSRLWMEAAQVQKAWIDIKKLSEAMYMYFTDRDLLKQHGSNARDYANKWYRYDTIMAKWDELLDTLYTNIDFIKRL